MKVEQIGPSTFCVFWHNGVHIGDIEREVDGEYVFYPVREGGSWSGYVLRLLANRLDDMNNPKGQQP